MSVRNSNRFTAEQSSDKKLRWFSIIATIVPLLIGAFLWIGSNFVSPTTIAPVVALAEGEVKLIVTEDGLHRISQNALATQGMSLNSVSTDMLSLSHNGQPVPFMADNDGIIFYGQASTDAYTAKRPYILKAGSSGVAMQQVNAPAPTGASLTEIPQTLRLEDNKVYRGKARTPDSEDYDVWFWEAVQVGQKVNLNITLPEIVNAPTTARMGLWGASYDNSIDLDHDIDLVINEQNVDTVQWDGEEFYDSESAIGAGVLRSGENNIILDNAVQGATLIDRSFLNWIELEYVIPTTAVNNTLTIENVQGDVCVNGFSEQPYLFNVSNPDVPTQITNWDYNNCAPITINQGERITAVAANGFKTPTIEGIRQSNWSDTTHQADLLIVTTDVLKPALAPLAEARQAQGLTVAIATVGEIYDEFGHGLESPESIRSFVRHAYENWQGPEPQYLFLVGEATYDFLGDLGEQPENIVPAIIVPATFSGETMSDAQLADVDGDNAPELAVGRWPVDSPELVEDLVRRTLAYETGEVSTNALFTADNTSTEFTTLSDRLIDGSQIPSNQAVRLYGALSDEVTETWNDGAWLVSYTGHGSMEMWGQQRVFSQDAVEELGKSGKTPPIVVQFSCLTGFFHHPTEDSISEVMLKNKNGPVLLVAATSLTVSHSQEPFATEFLRSAQDPSVLRVGDALQNAKAVLDVTSDNGAREVSDTFGLLGDPSALIARPSGQSSLLLNQ